MTAFCRDKAIDVIDEASARAGLSVYLPTPELSKLEASKRELEQKKEDAIIAEDFALAGETKDSRKSCSKRSIRCTRRQMPNARKINWSLRKMKWQK